MLPLPDLWVKSKCFNLGAFGYNSLVPWLPHGNSCLRSVTHDWSQATSSRGPFICHFPIRALGAASYPPRYAVKLKSLWNPSWCVHDYQISRSWWCQRAGSRKRWRLLSHNQSFSPHNSDALGVPSCLWDSSKTSVSWQISWILGYLSFHCGLCMLHPQSAGTWPFLLLTPGETFGSFSRGLTRA